MTSESARGLVQRRVFVTGRVQGVSFRQSTAEAARDLPGVRGFVRNLSDGRVEAVFAGAEPEVLKIVAWCRMGPSQARVDQLQVLEETPDPAILGLPAFEIRR